MGRIFSNHVPPSVVTSPVISGNPSNLGTTITMVDGVFRQANSVTNQWYADGNPIPGGTGDSLTISLSYVNNTIEVRQIATNSYGTALAVSNIL